MPDWKLYDLQFYKVQLKKFAREIQNFPSPVKFEFVIHSGLPFVSIMGRHLADKKVFVVAAVSIWNFS